jgi:hypothetical protein
MNYMPIFLNNKEEFEKIISDNALNPKKISDFIPRISQIENILTYHISQYLSVPQIFSTFIYLINTTLKINNDMNNLFALKGGNVFRYYVQKKYMDYWKKINIDIKTSLMTNIDTEHEDINEIVNMLSDFDFIYCIKEIDDELYRQKIIELYNSLYFLRINIFNHLINHAKKVLLTNINKNKLLLSLLPTNLEMTQISFDELITYNKGITYNYSYQTPNSMNISINNTITTLNNTFDLLRLKLLFNTIETKKKLFKAEVIDIAIYKNEHAVSYFDNKFVKINYNSEIHEAQLIELYIPSIKYIIQDLYLILFTNSTIAWDDNKYEKRLIRLIISLTINLTEETESIPSSLYDDLSLHLPFNDNINYYILFLNLIKYIKKNILLNDGSSPVDKTKYQEMEKHINILMVSILNQEQLVQFLNMEIGQFNRIEPVNDSYLKQLYNQGNIYDFMCKIILLYFYKFMRDTHEEYNIWRGKDIYIEDLLQFKKFIEIIDKTLFVAYINFIPDEIKSIIHRKNKQIIEKQSEYHLLGGQVDIMNPYQQQFITNNLFNIRHNKILFSDIKILINQTSSLLNKINKFCTKYYDEKDIYIINDKVIYQPYIKDEYMNSLDEIIEEQNKIFNM